MSGLLAARVLADFFDQVTVIERDRPPGRDLVLAGQSPADVQLPSPSTSYRVGGRSRSVTPLREEERWDQG